MYSCRLVRTKYRMAMAIAVFPPSLWPLGRSHYSHYVSRIPKVVSFKGQG
jgi:hypothetical protein